MGREERDLLTILIVTGDQGGCHLKCFGCKLHAPLPTSLAQARPGESHTRSGPQRELRETDICPHNQLAKYLELPQNGKIMAEVSNPAVTVRFPSCSRLTLFLAVHLDRFRGQHSLQVEGMLPPPLSPKPARPNDAVTPRILGSPGRPPPVGLFSSQKSHPPSGCTKTHETQNTALQSLWAYLAPRDPRWPRLRLFALRRRKLSLRVDASHKTAVASSTISPRHPTCARLRNNWADTMTRL